MNATVDMSDRLRKLEVLRDKIKVLEENLIRHKQFLNEVVKEIAEAIQNGETTGDPMRDLVIRFHGRDDAILGAKYRAVELALKGKKGEFVLLAFPGRRLVKHVFVGESEYANISCYRLGVLKEESLVFTADFLFSGTAPTIDVPRYIEGEVSLLIKGGLRRPLSVVNENIFKPRYQDDDPSPLYILLQQEGPWEDKIIIGDEAVKQWLEKKYMPGLFKPAADALSKLILESPDDVEEGFE